MENIQNKSALIPSDEIRSEELLAEQKFEVPCIRINTHGQIKMALTKKFTIMYVVGIGWSGVSIVNIRQC